MKLTILSDNHTLQNHFYRGEPGYSLFIESEDVRILFDTGYSGLFIENARKMNINLYDTDYLVLSNGRYNHSWGITELIKFYTEGLTEDFNYKKPALLTHPDTFKRKPHPEYVEIGSLYSEEQLEIHFDMKITRKPFMLTDNLIYLGEIPNEYKFDKIVEPKGIAEKNVDNMLEDSAIVCKQSDGIVIITGSSYAGVCNIIDYARLVCEEDNIKAIIGGFNLVNPEENRLKETLGFIKRIKPTVMYPCFNTDLRAKIALSQVARIKEAGVGLSLEF